jgi:type I restriction enzyme S subunit
MKDSGVEWLGKIPEGWEVQKLKHICNVKFSNVDKKSFGSERRVRLCNYVDVYNNDFITDEIEFMKATASRDEIAKFTLKKGDVIITKDSESWDDIAVPAYVFSSLEGVLCGYHLAHIRPDGRNIEGRYLLRAFVAQGINDQFRVSANGITRYGLSKHSIKSSLIPVPPNQEQIQIANYLDQKTTKIDGLIKKIKSQIEKLKEYRQTLISNVVTGKVRASDTA